MNNFHKQKDFDFIEDQIGSDEVGTGDFFGPIVVASVLIRKQDLTKLQEIGLRDSKKINDENIKKIGKFITENYPYKSFILKNEQFNYFNSKKKMNMNEIKCWMHNKVLSSLYAKHQKIHFLCIDQFVNKEKYNEYLIKNNKTLFFENKNLDFKFKTKGETYFPSVAAASIVARYLFLKEIEKMNKEYHTKFPLGAVNKIIDPFSIKFIENNGKKEFQKITKNNFKNYKRILNSNFK